jgi:putative ABC transport system permease protein
MLSNYLLIALRNLRKRPVFSAINLLGLTLGLTACLLILLYVRREKSMDTFHQSADRIFKVLLHVQMTDGTLKMAALPPAFAPRLLRDISSVESAVRVYDPREMSVSAVPEQVFYEQVFYADTSFFDVFSFPIVEGAMPKQALARPNGVVISQKMADKYFPGQNAIGQSLLFDAKHYFTVSAVMANVPANSHLQFDVVLPWSTLKVIQPQADDDNFGWAGASCFLKLANSTDVQQVENQIPALLKKYFDDNRATRFSLHLQSFPSVYFGSGDYQNVLAQSLGDKRYLNLFSWLAVIILAIACINFINLSTARASERAREVGMRKSLGAARGQLVRQFLSEGMVLAVFAFVLALGVLRLLAPYSGLLFGVPLQLDFASDPALLTLFGGIVLGTGLLAGFYPAFVLSAFRPVAVLKNQLSPPKAGLWLRKSLVVVQFTATVVLMIASLVVFRQMKFLQEKNPGFNQEQVLVLPLKGKGMQQAAPRLSQLLTNQTGVTSVCLSSHVFDGSVSSSTTAPEGTPEGGGWQTAFYSVDDAWLRTTGVRLLAGRFFAPEFTRDTATHLASILVNETAVREFGWRDPGNALGKRIAANQDTAIVVGVVSDFNFNSLHSAIAPIMLYKDPSQWLNVMVRLQSGSPASTLTAMRDHWQTVYPQYPFEYYFLDEHLAQLYQTEQRAALISACGTGLAIGVACLGLLGLTLFTVQRKSKEIGIRKVLGATVAGITGLLAKDFLKLVLIAIVIASPIAYYFMQKWLSDFAYRIELQWWMFAAAGILALAIAFLTVGFQSVKAALANPVKSLRSE